MTGMEITGIDTMLADIRNRFQGGANKVERVALRAAGEVIAQEEKSIVAVSDRDGVTHIRDDIYVTRVSRKDGMKYVLVKNSKRTSWRTHFEEFGTSKQSARPFKEPAFQARKGAALQIIANTFREGLKRG
ncbi:HK97 gp10 family phage protein [Paenibacillus turicensis]|uniref:HK97 gp10 family phage protein n=1 Tax=Paenibacillus turicensis TaxID=160487 RepID=A0ABS4FX80_9BACL|nr:HK97-gp10 family putative phage morphogenesis protein [Paenibacillus turicensis]MBP1907079.1 HK97 gp10 family phage protein [Paenibacillus turicensis]